MLFKYLTLITRYLVVQTLQIKKGVKKGKKNKIGVLYFLMYLNTLGAAIIHNIYLYIIHIIIYYIYYYIMTFFPGKGRSGWIYYVIFYPLKF